MELFSIDTYVDECLVIQEHPGAFEIYADDPVLRGCLLVKNRDRHWTACFEQHYGMIDYKEHPAKHENISKGDTDHRTETDSISSEDYELGEGSSTSSNDYEMGLLRSDYL